VVIADETINYIHNNTTFIAKDKSVFFGTTNFYLWLLSPLLLIPIALIIGNKYKQRANDILGNKRRKADRLARKYLSEAKKELTHKERFYIALEKALHNYLKATLHVETSEISKEKIETLLLERHIDTDTIAEFIKVLRDCDFARYAPSSEVQIKDDFDRAKRLITALDKQF